jgi:CheB methylesterase
MHAMACIASHTIKLHTPAYSPSYLPDILNRAGSLRDDGTAGLQAIKQCAGIAVTQDPQEALYPSMPLSALTHVQVDYNLALYDIGSLLVRLVAEPVEEKELQPVRAEMKKEMVLTEMDPATSSNTNRAVRSSIMDGTQSPGGAG